MCSPAADGYCSSAESDPTVAGDAAVGVSYIRFAEEVAHYKFVNCVNALILQPAEFAELVYRVNARRQRLAKLKTRSGVAMKKSSCASVQRDRSHYPDLAENFGKPLKAIYCQASQAWRRNGRGELEA